jgi:uroporphyrinogen-III decarboxylase
MKRFPPMLEQGTHSVMKPRQRVTAAMRNGVPDRVPVIPQICHPHAIRFFGMEYEATVLDCIRNPRRVNELQFECARAYGVDGVRVWPLPAPMDVVQVDGVWHGCDPQTGAIKGRVDFEGGGWVVEPERNRLADERAIDAIARPAVDEILKRGELEAVEALVREAGDDLFVISTPGCFTVEYLASQRGKEQALMDLVERPAFCHRVMHKALSAAVQKALALAEVGIHGLMIADTFGGVIGPELFKEFCLPYFRQFTQTLTACLGDRRPLIYLHICGNSAPLLDLMADTGVDCVEPLDVLGGVQVHEAKRRIGDRVALMGGVSTLELATGTLEDLNADVDRCLSEGATGGGYILACSDMLPTETSPAKVQAMLTAAGNCRYGRAAA